VIANLFLHYAFDRWMAGEFPGVAFERYVDDAVIHCVSENQAREVLAALQERMSEVGLALHPDKTRIVYCQDARRRGSHEHTSFTFLGYGFRGRRVRTRSGPITTGFVPAISKDAMTRSARWCGPGGCTPGPVFPKRTSRGGSTPSCAVLRGSAACCMSLPRRGM
jgi:RNA-directed DNA polymerase